MGECVGQLVIRWVRGERPATSSFQILSVCNSLSGFTWHPETFGRHVLPVLASWGGTSRQPWSLGAPRVPLVG